jgi:FixJ family two-component response regulator
MQPTVNATVFIVDDDAIVREGMAWLLRSRHLISESFESADAFEMQTFNENTIFDSNLFNKDNIVTNKTLMYLIDI